MEITLALGSLIGGFAILLFGGEALVGAAVSLASRMKVSPAVIGLTIIAAGTSAPELATSVIASVNENPDIAVGNVIGSNVFNILAILGIASLIKPNKVSPNMIRWEFPALLIFTLVFVYFVHDQIVYVWEGLICLAGLTAFFWATIVRARKRFIPHEEEISKLKGLAWDLGYLTVGLVALVVGANIALNGGIALGRIYELSERVIGITIISVGTGLPELATSAVAAYRGRNDIAVSNVIGSNLINTLGVLGTASTIKTIEVAPELAGPDSWVMLATTFVILPLVWINKDKISRPSGGVLLLGYIAYVTFLLYR